MSKKQRRGRVRRRPPRAHPALRQRGHPALCEEPVARDSAVAAELGRRVADAGTEVHIGYPRRFDVAFAGSQGRDAP